jgi:serine/threonine protein phosphatase 1
MQIEKSQMQVEKFPSEMIPMRNGRPPSIQKGTRIYAVGDVHGRADLLEQILIRIDHDSTGNPGFREIEVFLGDYVDRGPSSANVITQLIQRSEYRETIFLRGNHEEMLLAFLQNPAVLGDWQQVGGLETLMSYGLQPVINPSRQEESEFCASFNRMLPRSHRDFFQKLRGSYQSGDYFFVHAGVRPGIPLSKQREQDLLWIRNDFLEHDGPFEKIVVHGHTPVIEPQILSNRINLDTGAYATGRLTCFVFERDYVRSI